MCPSSGTPVLERYVEQRLDDAAPAADQADGVAVTRPGRAPDDRPRLVPLERRDGGPGAAGGDGAGRSDRRRPSSAAAGRWAAGQETSVSSWVARVSTT